METKDLDRLRAKHLDMSYRAFGLTDYLKKEGKDENKELVDKVFVLRFRY